MTIREVAKGALLLGAMTVAGWTSCFFDPREAEKGAVIDTSATRWRPAATPQVLVTNVRVTFEDRQIDFYDRAFSDTFLFRADPLDSTDEAFAGRFPFANWDDDVERSVAERIFIDADRISLTLTNLTPPDSVSEGGNFVRLRKFYELSVVSVDSIAPDSVQVDSAFYKGTLTFYMNQPRSDWVLYRWEDSRAPEPGIPSWGALRARNRQ